MDRKQASDFDPRALVAYDDFAHGRISRREFATRLAGLAGVGLTAEALIEALTPNYAWAQQVSPEDPRIVQESFEYNSEKGGGKIRGVLAYPKQIPSEGGEGKKYPAVLVIHENRGLNPYIADVARRLATAGFLALAPDALSPLGGYPGNDDEGRTMQAKRKPEEMFEDFHASVLELAKHPRSNGNVGAVGFCYGGGVVNQLAVRLPGVLKAGVPYYGRQAPVEDVPKIQAPLLLQYAELDTRINEGWPAYEAALRAQGKRYEAHIYPGVNHGFHNDSTPRYDEAAAKLSWDRTLEFFRKHLS